MNFQQCILVVAILAVTSISGESGYPSQDSNLRLLNYMSRSNDLMHQNPSRSLTCFAYYAQLLDQLTSKYANDHLACEEASEEQGSHVETATLDKRNDLGYLTNDACSSLSKCQHIESAEKSFECFVNGGNENAKVLKKISTDASEHLFDFQEDMRLVKRSEYSCTNQTKRAYDKVNSETVDNLNKCILGKSDVPNITTETVIVVNSTEQPGVPEISEGPEDSEGTEAPTELPIENEPTGELVTTEKIPTRFER